MSYTKRIMQGISWTAGLRYSSRFLAVIQAALLARFFLTAYEFGLYGIASLVLVLLEIVTETGINVFLIQKKESIDEYISSAWLVSIVRGIVISLVMLVSAGVVVTFFNSPDAYRILIFLSLVPIVRGFINPSIVKFQKDLDFHKEFYLRTAILIVSFIVTLVTASLYRNAMSLVYGLLAGAVVEVILSFIFIKPLPAFVFSTEKVKEVLHHGKWVTLYGIFAYFSQETDDIALGRILGVSPLGSYQLAYKFGTLPITEVTEVVHKVIFPMYSKMQANKRQLYAMFVKTSQVLSSIILLFGLLLFFFAHGIVVFILGAQWVGIASIVQLLVIYGVIRAISGLTIPLFLAVGRQRYVATATFVRFVGLVVAIIPFLSMYGIEGAAYASIVSAVVELPVLGYYLRKEFDER